MLLQSKPELHTALRGKTALITGAGGGIGFEAAKAFAFMGARVLIAEINREKGSFAEAEVNRLFPGAPAVFIEVDLSDDFSLSALISTVYNDYGCPDILFHNATITKMGAVDEVELGFWDKSYAVNLRAPLILTQRFLPEMKKCNSGTVVFVSSSGASPYMGAYEIFKTAQVELSNTLAMELEESGVYTFTIGPGLVKTETAMNAIGIVARKMGMSLDAFYEMNGQHIIDAERAGVGFALAALNAKRYHGQEIGSIQVLMDYDLIAENGAADATTAPGALDTEQLRRVLLRIQDTYEQQYSGWSGMNIFERQWVLRDFKKNTAVSAEQAKELLGLLLQALPTDYSAVVAQKSFFTKLKDYWQHQLNLLKGYEKDKQKLEENTLVILGWVEDIDVLLKMLA